MPYSSIMLKKALKMGDVNMVKQKQGRVVYCQLCGEPLHPDRACNLKERPEKAFEKITFYFPPELSDKLDVLTLAYRQKTRKRVNRNDLVRHLVAQCSLESFEQLSL